MDKHLTKKLLAAEGLPTAAWDLFDLSGGTLPLLPGSLDLPLVVKPRFEGSSAGVDDRAHPRAMDRCDAGSLEDRSDRSSPKSTSRARVHVRRARRGSASGRRDRRQPRRLLLVRREVRTRREHARRPGADRRRSRRPATDARLSTHRLLGLRDYSRTDFIVSRDLRPYILEINSLPGLTPTSLFPDACAAAGHYVRSPRSTGWSGYALARGETCATPSPVVIGVSAFPAER